MLSKGFGFQRKRKSRPLQLEWRGGLLVIPDYLSIRFCWQNAKYFLTAPRS